MSAMTAETDLANDIEADGPLHGHFVIGAVSVPFAADAVSIIK